MKIQSLTFGSRHNLIMIYDNKGDNRASAFFVTFVKRVVDELEKNPKTRLLTIYLQHYVSHGTLLTRGTDVCKLLITDFRHKAEVEFSIDKLNEIEDTIRNDILEQWSSYVSLTRNIPFELVV